jgi:hypothetical protein
MSYSYCIRLDSAPFDLCNPRGLLELNGLASCLSARQLLQSLWSDRRKPIDQKGVIDV